MSVRDIFGNSNSDSVFAFMDGHLTAQGALATANSIALNTVYDEDGDLDGASIEQNPELFSAYTLVEISPPDPGEVARRHLGVKPIVRRPLLGLHGYEERFAQLEVLVRSGENSAGTAIELFNSSYKEGKSGVNTNFIIQQVAEEMVEAVQIVETFGDYYLADVGEKPRLLQVTGVLFEAKNFPWMAEWRKNYDQYLRARQCIIRRAQAYLTVGDQMFTGYIINSTLSRAVTSSWVMVPFSFTMVLRNVIDVRPFQLFPDQENPDQGFQQRVTEGTSDTDTYVDGIRIPNTVAFDPTAAPTAISKFSNGQLREYEDIVDDIVDNPDYSVAQAIEILQGELQGQVQLQDPILVFKGDVDTSVTEMSLDRLVAIARQINSSYGTEVFNLQRVRVGYMAQRQAVLSTMGLYDPYGPSTYGLPTAYQDEVDARRRRQQEETLAAITGAFEEEFGRIDWL